MKWTLGLSQLKKYPDFLVKRQYIANNYNTAFENTPVCPLVLMGDRTHAYHLYVVKIPNRERVYAEMRHKGIGVNVHYIPVYRHPYYVTQYGDQSASCPTAESVYSQILSLPIYPELTKEDQKYVINTLLEIVSKEY